MFVVLTYAGDFIVYFLTKTLCSLLSPIRATLPTHLTVLNLITRMWFGEQDGSLSFSLSSLLHSPVTSPLSGPSIFLSTLLEHPQTTFLPQYERSGLTHVQNYRENHSSVYMIFIFLGRNFSSQFMDFIIWETCKAFLHPVHTIFVVNLYSRLSTRLNGLSQLCFVSSSVVWALK